MALSDEQQRDILARITDIILRDFHTDFEDIYSYAVTVLELAPEQANNEVRNALNHIARALLAGEMVSADENLLQAKGHIERAKRDCVKLAVIHLHEQAKSDLLSVEMTEGAVPMSVKARLRTIERAGAAARRAEADGEQDILDKYGAVLADLKEFREDNNARFSLPSHQLDWWERTKIRARRHLSGFIVGVLVAIAGHWIYDHLLQPSPVKPPPAAASTLSTGAKPDGAKQHSKSHGTGHH